MAANNRPRCYDGRGVHLGEFGIDMTLDDFLTEIGKGGFNMGDTDAIMNCIEEIEEPLLIKSGNKKTLYIFNTDPFDIPAIEGIPAIEAHISEQEPISSARYGAVGRINVGEKQFIIKAIAETDHMAASVLAEAVIHYLLYRNPVTRPHVCGVYRILRHEDQMYIIMEQMAMTADEIIMEKDGNPNQSTYSNGYASLALHTIHSVLEMAQRFESIRQICDFVHGDFKPDNMMLSFQGSYRLIDFGFSSMYIDTETHKGFHLNACVDNGFEDFSNNAKNSDCRNLAQLFFHMIYDTKEKTLFKLWGQNVDDRWSLALKLVHPIIRNIPREITQDEYPLLASYIWFNDNRFEPTTNRKVIERLNEVLETLRAAGMPTDRTLDGFMRERRIVRLLDHSAGLQVEELPVGLVDPFAAPVAGVVPASRRIREEKAAQNEKMNEALRAWNTLSPAEKQAIYAAEEAEKRKAAAEKRKASAPKQKAAPKQKVAAAPRGRKAAVEMEAPVAAVAAPKRKVAAPAVVAAPVAAPAVSSRAARAASRGQEAKGGNYTIGGKRLKLKHTLKRNKYTKKFHNSTRKHFKKHTSSRKRIHHRK